MMKKTIFLCLLFLVFFEISAQRKDSIFISAEWKGGRDVEIKQRIVYHHQKEKSLPQIKLMNWIEAYKSKKTPLANRKLEDGKSMIRFAKKEQLGSIEDLKIWVEGEEIQLQNIHQENLYLPISLLQNEQKEILLSYKINLPDANFTGYGKGRENLYLKYFFLVPDTFEDENQSPKYFLDLEETQNVGSFWAVDFKMPEGYFLQTNLVQNQGKFQGVLNEDLEIYISKSLRNPLEIIIDNQRIGIDFAYEISKEEWASMEFYLPLHLSFIKEKLGWLPNKILVSPKQKKQNIFLGSDEVYLGRKRMSLFTPAEKTDLDYFSLVSQNILNQVFISDKNKEHWLKNGLKTYLEFQYIKKFYVYKALLGNVKDLKILGMRPLKWMNASNLKLMDRYAVGGYLLSMYDNRNQAIGTPFEKLTNFNKTAISHFKMGVLLNFVADKEGRKVFENFIKSYLIQNQGKRVEGQDFLKELLSEFGHSYEFLKDYIDDKQRIDFRLESMQKISENEYQIKVSKNTPISIPFKLQVKDKQENINNFWLNTEENQTRNIYQLNLNQPKKLVVNPNFIFPEVDFRNNYSEKRWFGLSKKLKFKLFTDLPNPEFNEVYLKPDFRYNIYDDALIGINFSNIAIVSPLFTYSFTPYFSIGERRLMGMGGVSYKIQPKDSFFRRLTFGASGAYFHYNFELAYRKISLFSAMDFKEKNPRSLINKRLNLLFQYIDRGLPEQIDLSSVYAHYGLWTLNFYWRDRNPIHEKHLVTSFEYMRDFQKVSLEANYYWEYIYNRRVHFRFYGGAFLNHQAKNTQFDFGVSRINDYNFTYSLLGTSATSGLFAQQFILAEAGFKSYVGDRADQWITALNMNVPIWRMFSFYGDVGVYKNKNIPEKVIWDSGVRMSILPEVLYIYFPLQSSLGFEPNLPKYDKRIRFSLDLDLNKIYNAIRRKRAIKVEKL